MAIHTLPDRSSSSVARHSRIIPYPGVTLPDDSTPVGPDDASRLLITTAADEANLAQGWWRSRIGLMREIFNDARRDEVLSVAGSMAYTTLFALVPMLLFLTALSGF